MSEEMIVRLCSPTLAGIKTASLFACKFQCRKKLWNEIRRYNRMLTGKGVRMLPIQVSGNTALIYLYRPSRLEKDLSCKSAAGILQSAGYQSVKSGYCIAELMRRLREGEDFPHEIGLFLGYPPEDVYGFIVNKGCGCKCAGCWKVYGDESEAQKRFDSYRRCTRIYRERHANGVSVERLTVAV